MEIPGLALLAVQKSLTYPWLYPIFGTIFFHPLGRKGFRDRDRRISDYNQVCMASTTGLTVESSKTAAQSSAVTYVR